jgi:chloride channel 7
VSAGISAAFNSPIGGVLFVVEDLAARWLIDAHLILQCFVSSFFSQLVVAGAHITSLLVQTARSGGRGEFQAVNLVVTTSGITGAWYLADVPLCVLLGAGIGALLGFSTAAANAIARVRSRVMGGALSGGGGVHSSSRMSEVVAAVFPVVLISVLAFVVPLLFGCRVRQDHVSGAPAGGASQPAGPGPGPGSGPAPGLGVPGQGQGQHLQVDHRMFVRFTCEQGQYNDMASLLLPSLSGSYASTLSHLYSRDADQGAYTDASLLVLAVCFYIFPFFIIGCSFPFGLFVPNLVFGSATGHLFGRLVNRSAWVSSRVAHPAVYAVLGAGAALGGWTRMAITISAIMLEQTGNMDSLLLMMVTVLSSRLVAGFLTTNSFTDEVIKQKGYQVLAPREPAIMQRLSAGQVCTRSVVCLRPDEDVAAVVRVLVHTTHTAFPVCLPASAPIRHHHHATGQTGGGNSEGSGPPEAGNSHGPGSSFNDSPGVDHCPVWRVETGGHLEEPELLGLVARSTLLDMLEEMVNARRPSEREAAHLHVPASMLGDRVSLTSHSAVISVVRRAGVHRRVRTRCLKRDMTRTV